MRRRTLLKAGGGAVAVGLAAQGLPAVAQTPEADPHFAGELLKATRAFAGPGFRFGALVFTFVDALFDTEDHATQGLDLTRSLVEQGANAGVTEVKRMGVPEVGDERLGLLGTVRSEAGTKLRAAFVLVRADTVTHLWTAVGFADVVEELTTVTETVWAERGQEGGDADTDEERLLRALPTVEDLPTGFTLGRETVEPGDDA